jgi:hypothetical protein
MIHWVLSTFKLVYGHLISIFLTNNFVWAFSKLFVNSGQKDMAKFPNFDPCTVCGKTFRVPRGVYLPAFWATPPYYSITCFLGHTLIFYNCNKGCGPKSRWYCNKGVWPKKQVNKPLLKPAIFWCTLCRGQNLGILPCPFGHCLHTVWRRPTQNCRSKRCRLGDHIPIWKWTELSESYGIYIYIY